MLDLGGKRLHQDVGRPISRFYTYGNSNATSNSQSSCTRPITNFAPVLNPMTDMPVILHLPFSLASGLAFF
jgi:dihydroorotase